MIVLTSNDSDITSRNGYTWPSHFQHVGSEKKELEPHCAWSPTRKTHCKSLCGFWGHGLEDCIGCSGDSHGLDLKTKLFLFFYSEFLVGLALHPFRLDDTTLMKSTEAEDTIYVFIVAVYTKMTRNTAWLEPEQFLFTTCNATFWIVPANRRFVLPLLPRKWWLCHYWWLVWSTALFILLTPKMRLLIAGRCGRMWGLEGAELGANCSPEHMKQDIDVKENCLSMCPSKTWSQFRQWVFLRS